MTTIKALIQRVAKTKHGFTDIKKASEEIFAAETSAKVLAIAKELFASEIPQARMLATFLLGRLSVKTKESFSLMRKKVSTDADWRVQEILAQAFDQYCKDNGYKKSMPVIKDWLKDPNPNTRRA